MKSFITAIIIAALLIAGSELHMMRLERASYELSELNSDVFEHIMNEEYDEALEAVSKLSVRMKEAEMFFGAMGDQI